MRNYKEMARAMRENAWKAKIGVLGVTAELWEELADALEEKTELETLVRAGIAVQLEPISEDRRYVKLEKDGMKVAFIWSDDAPERANRYFNRALRMLGVKV
jgi:hypothetical protein